MKRRRTVVLNHRAAVQGDLDLLAWVVGITLASLLRVDFELPKLELAGQLAIVPVVIFFHLLVAGPMGLYSGRFRSGSFEELAAVARVVALATPLIFVVDLVASNPRMVPLTAVLGGAVIALVLMAGTRYVGRMRYERSRRPAGDDLTRVVVVGAGVGGEQVVASMLRDPDSAFLPVALLDDDREKRDLRLKGVPVVGTTDQVVETAAAYDAATVVIAIPSASRDVIGRVTRQANEAGLVVKTLPTVPELLEGRVGVGDIRDLSPADLLGRHEVDTDVGGIAAYLRDRRVLVTGAGGSIGSELCRQISAFAPAELIMLDRDESALHAVQLSITGRALLDTPDVVLADLRDRAGIERVFAERRPQVVFHAAALKHLPMLEQYPAEGFKTNVLGTQALLELAAAYGVDRFVNVSTDKAADPESVLGYTKRIAERLTAWAGNHAACTFLSVRFGNVLGSRGSVLDTFRFQINSGGPVTITHPEVTRYFMTISEAVQLVVQAGAIGASGEVLVLDMGAPVRIADVAEQLIAQSGQPIGIAHTGLRPGEKLHEQLFGSTERGERRVHPLISHVVVPPLDPATVGSMPLTPLSDPATAARALRRLATEVATPTEPASSTG